MSEKQYGHDDARDYEPYFSRHLMAMTTEDLHSKGEIACELAYRDQRIAELEAENARLRGQSLLRKVGEPLLDGCYCTPGKCAAPKPSWCRDLNKRDALLGVGNE